MCAELLQSCLTLCDPMDCSLRGFSVHGILQARILEWVAMSSSRGSFQTRDWPCLLHLLHWQVGSLPLAPPRKPEFLLRPSKEMTVTRVLYDMKLIKQKDRKQSDRKYDQKQNRGKCRNAFILFYSHSKPEGRWGWGKLTVLPTLICWKPSGSWEAVSCPPHCHTTL